MERLSGLDATFLYLETPTHHMHVAATMVIDPVTMPGGYSFDKIKDFIGARVHLVPPFTPPGHGGAVPRPPPDLGRGSGLRPRLPRPPDRGALPGRSSRARRGGRSGGEHAARPLPSAVGALGGRRAQAGPGGHRHEGPPLRHRRRLRRGADGPPLRPRAGDGRPASTRRASRSASRPASSCSGTPRCRGRGATSGSSPSSAPRCSRSAGWPRDAGPRSTTSARSRSPPLAHRGTRPSARTGRSGFARVSLADVKAVKNRFGRHGERRGAGVWSAAPSAATWRATAACPTNRCSRCARCRSAPPTTPAAATGVGHVHVARHRHRRSRRRASRPSTRSRRGAKEEHNAVGAGHAPELGRVRRSQPLQPGGAPVLEPRPGRQPPADPQRDHLQRARAGLPALLRGRRAGGGLPDGTGDGGRRPQRHRHELPGERSTSASWSTRTWCPTCGPWPMPSSPPSRSSWPPSRHRSRRVRARTRRSR